jgi:drug/metabolite transporter (DMT)-like permease
MKNWMSGIRGSVVMIVLWVIGWSVGFGGIMEVIDPDGRIQDVWPTLLAVPGLIGGVIFAAAFLAAERNVAFDRVPIARYGLWGAVSGFALGLLSIPAEVGDVSPGTLGMIVIGIVLGTVAGLGSWVFVRLASKWTANAA